MRPLAAVLGCALLAMTLVDAFLTVVVARRAQRIFRLTAYFYRLTWLPYSWLARRIRSGRRREDFLSFYGPLSLLLLLAVWVACIVAAFTLLQWSAHLAHDGHQADLLTDLYISATDFFTLGLVDPSNVGAKVLTVIEVGIGYSFLGLIIGYPPVLFGLYSARETRIALLDARAGSPPTAAEFIARQCRSADRFERDLEDWEAWEASLLQSHLSYSMLAYFRSQHTNESWLASLVTILDVSAVLTVAGSGDLKRQAQLTFAMGRHALVDLAVVHGTPPHTKRDRLHPDDLRALQQAMAGSPVLDASLIAGPELTKIRETYEPFAESLAVHFLMAMPKWTTAERKRDNWQVTSWDTTSPRYAVSDPFSAEG